MVAPIRFFLDVPARAYTSTSLTPDPILPRPVV